TPARKSAALTSGRRSGRTIAVMSFIEGAPVSTVDVAELAAARDSRYNLGPMRKPTTLLLVLAAGLSCSKDTTGPKGPGPVAVVHVIPDSTTLDVFDTLRLRTVALDANGDTVFSPGAIGWMSAAPNTVFVSSVGRVQGLRRGTVTITASAGGVSGTA